jgi:phosphoserine aminotransferase
MSERIYNFSAGPAILPVEVLEKAQSEMLSLMNRNERNGNQPPLETF